MPYRLVPTQNARSAADAEAFVISDSGGSVIPAGETVEVDGGWCVQVYSTDGLSSPPAGVGRVIFHVVAISPDGTKATLKDTTGFHFDVPRSHQEFLGGTIQLQTNQIISALIARGTQDEIIDVVIESDLKERREFESVASDIRGWEPRNNPQKPAGQE
jgi:hypothetical protein